MSKINTWLSTLFIITCGLRCIACSPIMDISKYEFPHAEAEEAGKISWMEFLDGDFYMELEEYKNAREKHSGKNYHSSALSASVDHAASLTEIF